MQRIAFVALAVHGPAPALTPPSQPCSRLQQGLPLHRTARHHAGPANVKHTGAHRPCPQGTAQVLALACLPTWQQGPRYPATVTGLKLSR